MNQQPSNPAGAAAPAAPGNKFQIKKEDHPKIIALLKSIEDDPNAEPFLEPVQWQELGLLDYP